MACTPTTPSKSVSRNHLLIPDIPEIIAVFQLTIPPDTPQLKQCSLCFKAIIFACQNKQWEKIKRIGEGILGLRDGKDRSLFSALLARSTPAVIEGVIERGFHAALASYDFRGDLHYAVRSGNMELFKLLWEISGIDKKDSEGKTPLHVAIETGQEEMVGALMQNGASVVKGYTYKNMVFSSWAYSIKCGQIECFDILATGKVDLWVQPVKGVGNLLHVAIQFGQLDCLRHLLTRYHKQTVPLLNQQNMDGYTPLILAAYLGDVDSIALLKDTNLTAIDEKGRTALHLAALNGHRRAIKLLLSLKIDLLNLNDSKGKTAAGLAEDPTIKSYLQNIHKQTEAFPRLIHVPQNLLFSGGACQDYKGALEALPIKEVKRVGGTQGGAIVATLLAFDEDVSEVTKEALEAKICKRTKIAHCTFGEFNDLIKNGRPFKHLHLFSNKFHFSSEDPKWKDLIISDTVFMENSLYFKDRGNRKADENFTVVSLSHCPIDAFDCKRYLENGLTEEQGDYPIYNHRTLVLAVGLEEKHRVIPIEPGDLGKQAVESYFKNVAILDEDLFYRPAVRSLISAIDLRASLPYFVGREKEMAHLEKALFNDKWKATDPVRCFALLGPEGQGKSELACTFANSHIEQFSLIHWVNCETEKTRARSYHVLAKALKIPTEAKPEEIRKALFLKLENHRYEKPWLLILDNLEEKIPYPQRGGCILSTSRRQGFFNHLLLPSLTESEAILLLERRTKQKDRHAMQLLIKELVCSPLFLNNAADYMIQKQIPVSEYLIDLKEDRSIIYQRSETERYPCSIKKTWTFEALQKSHLTPSAWLKLFHPAYVPTPCSFDPQVLPHLIFQQSTQDTSSAQLLEAGAADRELVEAAYRDSPIEGCVIDKIEVIVHKKFADRFNAMLEDLEERSVHPNWEAEAICDEEKIMRREVHQHLYQHPRVQTPTAFKHVKVMPLFLETKKDFLETLYKANVVNLPSMDKSLFGKGLSHSSSAFYANKYATEDHRKGVLLLNWVCFSSVYPVIYHPQVGDKKWEDLSPSLKKRHWRHLTDRHGVVDEKYDAHYVLVSDADGVNYLPPKNLRDAQFNQLITFRADQILPRYLISLTPHPLNTKQLEVIRFTRCAIKEQLEELRKKIPEGPLARAVICRLNMLDHETEPLNQKDLIELGHLITLNRAPDKAQYSAKFFIEKINHELPSHSLDHIHSSNTFPFPSFFDAVVPSFTLRSSGSEPFTLLERALQEKKYEEAEIHLIALLRTDANVERSYQYLIELLPDWKDLVALFIALPIFLKRITESQRLEFANRLSDWYEKKQAYKEAIYSATKGSLDLFWRTSRLFSQFTIPYLKNQMKSSFFLKLEPKKYADALKQFSSFLLTEEDRNALFTHATRIFNQMPLDESTNQGELTALSYTDQPITKKYHTAFQPYQSHFSQEMTDVRTFQSKGMKHLQKFFRTLMKDALLILGPAPCPFDLRAIGPFGREEIEPSLDFECVLLVEKTDHYFFSLMEILSTQLLTLGKKLNWKIHDLVNISNLTFYRSTSLFSTSPKVFLGYQECCLSVSRPLPQFQRTLNASPLASIKKNYIEPLNQFLNELALFNSIDKANSIELVDKLIEISLFTKSTGDLLKRTLEDLYQIVIGGLKNELEVIRRSEWLIFAPLQHLPYSNLEQTAAVQGYKAKYELAVLLDELKQWIVPYETGIKIDGPISGYLSPKVNIFDENGDIRIGYRKSSRNPRNSQHRVCFFDKFHFKQQPSHPVMEFAIYDLYCRCGGLVPPSLLFQFTVAGKSYPVLISKTIPGRHPVKNEEIEPVDWTRLLLCSVLTRPGDADEANLVVNNKKCWSVDNDTNFVEPVVLKDAIRIVQFYSAAFFMKPLDTPLDRNALEEFAAIDRAAIVEGWIDAVIEKEKEYTDLFSEKTEALYNDPQLPFTSRILFKEGAIATLNLQFIKLQHLIQQEKNLTAGDLLKALVSINNEAVGTYVYKTYLTAKTLHDVIPGKSQSQTSTQYAVASLGIIPTYEQIEAKNLFSPEQAKNELSAFLKDPTSANLEYLRTDPSREITVLKALAQDMQMRKFPKLGLIHSHQLDEDLLMPFLHVDLLEIDLRHCIKLKNKTVKLIQEKCPKLKTLLLRGCAGITVLEGWLLVPSVSFPCLEEADFSHCVNLRTLQIDAAFLQKINIKHNPLLKISDRRLLLSAIDHFPESILSSAEDLMNEDFIREAIKRNPKCLSYVRRQFVLKVVQKDGSKLQFVNENFKNDAEIIKAAMTQNFQAIQYVNPAYRLNSEFIFYWCKENPNAMSYADESLKKNEQFVLAAIDRNPAALKYAGVSFQMNRNFVLAAVVKNPMVLKYADDDLQKNKDFVLAAVVKNPMVLNYADDDFQNNKGFVLAAVVKNPMVLNYAGVSFQKDNDFILGAIAKNPEALQYADEGLKENEKFILAATKINPKALKYADGSLMKNKSFVLTAIKINPKVLKYADINLQNDIVLAAVTQNACALQFADESLKKNEKIVLAAVTQNGLALKYAHDRLKKDEKIVLAAVTQNWQALQYAHESLKKNETIVLSGISFCSSALKYAHYSLNTCEEFVLAAVTQNWRALEYVYERLKMEEKIVLAAVTQNWRALEYAHESLKMNEKIVLAAVSQNGLALKDADVSLKKNERIVLAAVTKNWQAFEYADKSLMNNETIVLAVVSQNSFALGNAYPRLKENPSIVLAAVSQNGLALEDADQSFKMQETIVLAAVSQNGNALEFADISLKKNEKIVLAAVTQNWQAFRYAHENLKINETIVLAAVRQNAQALDYANQKLKENHTIILAAVTQNGLALRYAHDTLKQNAKIVLAAVIQNGLALQYTNLQNDESIVAAAVTQCGLALEYAHQSFKNNYKIVLLAVTQNGLALRYAHDTLRENPKVVLAAVTQNGLALQFADESLKNVESIVFAALTQNGLALQFADENLKLNEPLALTAVTQNGLAFQFADENLKLNEQFILTAITQCGLALEYADQSFKINEKIVLAAVTQNGLSLKYAHENLKKDEKIVLVAVTQNGLALQFADKSLKNDESIVLAAINQNSLALHYADDSLRKNERFVLASFLKRI